MINKKFNWTEISFKTKQVIIFIAHLILLKWMFYALYESGTLSSTEIFTHFAGMSIYGGLLIWISAFVAKRKYLKDGNKLID